VGSYKKGKGVAVGSDCVMKRYLYGKMLSSNTR
jgi:hypothetical protein